MNGPFTCQVQHRGLLSRRCSHFRSSLIPRTVDVDYILVPIYSIVACFRADNLQYLNYANFDNHVSGGWCAIGVDNCLYGSSNSPSSVVKYEVDWDVLTDENSDNHDALTYAATFNLYKSNGSALTLTDMQGGEFSNSGEMLYLVSGRGACFEWLGLPGAEWMPHDGIHAIATEDWAEIGQSTKNSAPTTNFILAHLILPPKRILK